MKKQVWVDVKDPSELRLGDRVRFTDSALDLYSGCAIGDGCGEEDFRFVFVDGIRPKSDAPSTGYGHQRLLELWKFVQVLRNVEDCPDSKTMAFDALCAVHEVLHNVPEYGAFVTLKDGRQVQVRAMVLAAIEELDKWQKGSAE